MRPRTVATRVLRLMVRAIAWGLPVALPLTLIRPAAFDQWALAECLALFGEVALGLYCIWLGVIVVRRFDEHYRTGFWDQV